jgi:ferredoxin-NADP reductase
MITNAPLPARTLTLKERTEIAERTMEFRFEKPSGMTFKAGQYLDLTLISAPESDEEGNTRSFSISASPDEDDLAIVTRLRDSAFKRTLQRMAPGTPIQAEGPFGDFVLHRNPDRPAVLLAGGIGVTPFHSMVRWDTHRGASRRILLFYSNRRPEDAPFLEEFRQLAERHPKFTFVPTMSRASGSRLSWDGLVGRIEYPLIQKHLRGDSAPPMFYLAGPPKMVSDLRTMLSNAGIGDDDIRTEEFTGY